MRPFLVGGNSSNANGSPGSPCNLVSSAERRSGRVSVMRSVISLLPSGARYLILGLRLVCSSEGESTEGRFDDGLGASSESMAEDVVGKRCVLPKTASQGVRGMSRSGRLAQSLSSSSSEAGKSKALKTEGLLSSKKVFWAAAGAVL